MQDNYSFNDLESMIGFLDTPFNETPYPRSAGYFYRLSGSISIRIDADTYKLKFLGTNHADSQCGGVAKSELESADDFVSAMGNRKTLLVECGSLKTEDHIYSELAAASANDHPPYGQVDFNGHDERSELARLANDALKAGNKVINMDMDMNPRAIPEIIRTFGVEETIGYLIHFLDFHLPEKEGLSRYITELLKRNRVAVSAAQISKAYENQSKLLNNEIRDDYMTDTIVQRLEPDEALYVAAHTQHIKEILRRLGSLGEILSFEFEAAYTPEILERDSAMEAERKERTEYRKTLYQVTSHS